MPQTLLLSTTARNCDRIFGQWPPIRKSPISLPTASSSILCYATHLTYLRHTPDLATPHSYSATPYSWLCYAGPRTPDWASPHSWLIYGILLNSIPSYSQLFFLVNNSLQPIGVPSSHFQWLKFLPRLCFRLFQNKGLFFSARKYYHFITKKGCRTLYSRVQAESVEKGPL